jgi:hypothetical protein
MTGLEQVVVGHFNYTKTVTAIRQRMQLPADTPVPCLTYIRRPIDRLRSLYSYYNKVVVPGLGLVYSTATAVQQPRRYEPLEELEPQAAADAVIAIGRHQLQSLQFMQMPLLTQVLRVLWVCGWVCMVARLCGRVSSCMRAVKLSMHGFECCAVWRYPAHRHHPP